MMNGMMVNGFISPAGLDMSGEMVRGGGAVLFAWADDYSPVKPFYLVKPKRSHKQYPLADRH